VPVVSLALDAELNIVSRGGIKQPMPLRIFMRLKQARGYQREA